MTAPSIILVEDDPPLRTLTARALQEHGYQVRPASSGPEMWVAFDAGPVDLVVLDVMLPGTNGIDLCRQIRRKSDVPIIFISAKGSETDRIVGLELEMQRMPPPLLLFPPELALPPLTWKPSSTALELVPVPFNTW